MMNTRTVKNRDKGARIHQAGSMAGRSVGGLESRGGIFVTNRLTNYAAANPRFDIRHWTFDGH
jgi:hypothetical protein